MVTCPGRFDRRIECQNIGLERDTVDHGDDFGHLLGAFGNGKHIVSNLPHQLAAFFCLLSCHICLLIGEASVISGIFRGGGHLLHTGRGLDQRC